MVVGGGIGGLAAAVRLLAQGLEVTLVEREPSTGGRAARIREQGYTFDAGPSLITMPGLLDELFALSGTTTAAELRLRRLEPFYQVAWRGEPRSFLFGGDRCAMAGEIAGFSSADARRYDAFMAASRAVYEVAILAAGRRPFLRLRDFLAVLPRMVGLRALGSVDAFVGHFFREPHVRQAFGFHPLFIGGDPFRVPAVYAALAYLQITGGVWYADGGVHSLVTTLDRLVGAGGNVLTSCPVTAILQRGGQVTGVRLEGGDELPADFVVSDADVVATRRLAGLPVRRPRQSMSCFLLYLGTTKQFPSLRHHTLLVDRDYRGFIGAVTARRRMPAGTSLYVHAPSRSEPGMAPAGGESISVLMPVPNLQGSPRWPEAGDELRERVIGALESPDGLALRGLRSAIAFERRWTPLDFRDRFEAEQGNAFGPEPLLLQSAYFRQHNRYRSPRGLYQVGAGTHPGAGIPGVLLSAEVTCALLADDARAGL